MPSVNLRGPGGPPLGGISQNIADRVRAQAAGQTGQPARNLAASIRSAFGKLLASRQGRPQRSAGALRPQPFSNRHIDPKIQQRPVDFLNALITEVQFPKLDGDSKNAAKLTIKRKDGCGEQGTGPRQPGP